MSSDIPPLKVEVIVDANGVVKGFNTIEQGLTQVTERTKSVSKTMSSLKTTMLGVFGGNIATQGIFAIQNALMQSKREFFEAQVATERLGRALDNMGGQSEEAKKQILDNVNAYSILGFEGAESANAMGTLITATNDVTQSTKLMAIAADLARYKHVDLQTAATILARGTQGSAKAFKELGITLDTTIPKNEAISKAFDELNAKIGGQATAYTKTFSGQMAVMKERMQEIFNVVAARVVPVLTTLFNLFNAGYTWVQKNSGALMVLASIMTILYAKTIALAIANAALALINPFTLILAGAIALAAAFVGLWNRFKVFRDSMAEGLATIVQLFGYLVGAVAKALGLLSRLPGGGFLKGVAEGADKAAISIGKVAKAVDDLKNKKVTAPKFPSIAGAVKPGNAVGITGNVPGGDATKGGGTGGGSTTVQYVTVYASNTNDIYKNLSKAAKNGVPVGGK